MFEELIGAIDTPLTDAPYNLRSRNLIAEALLADNIARFDARRSMDLTYLNADENLDFAMPDDGEADEADDTDTPMHESMEGEYQGGAMPSSAGAYWPQGDELTDVFGRYTTQAEPGNPFAAAGATADVPLNKETFTPLMETLGGGVEELSKYGYSDPVSDPYSHNMREALRKLVRRAN